MFFGNSPRAGAARRRQAHPLGRALLLGLLFLGLIVGIGGPGSAAAATGPVLAWGDNRSSQLGLAFNGVQRAAPGSVATALDSGMTALAGGRAFSLAVKSDGSVLSWGSNFPSGQLGRNSTADRLDPGAVVGVSGATAVAAGGVHGLALASGNVYAWGDNSGGQLGVAGNVSISRSAIQVGGLSGVTAIGAGYRHSLAVLGDGTVRAWGANGSAGALGDGTTTQRTTPVTVVGPGGTGSLAGVAAVAGGEGHSLALKTDGTVWAWGQNAQGQLGLGAADTNTHTAPAQVPGLGNIVAIAVGYRHSLALRGDGTLFAWGAGDSGQLGSGSIAANACKCSGTPAAVGGIGTVKAIGAGDQHSLAIRDDGAVFAFGDNTYLQIGVTAPAQVVSATQVPGLTGALAVAGGGGHSLVLQAVATPTFDLTVGTTGPGTVAVSPAGGRYPQGTQVTLTPQPQGNAIFTGWTVDGQAAGYASTLTITMNANHTVSAAFGVPVQFCDVNPGDLYFEAIRQLSARGIIRGFSQEDGDLCFGPDQSTLRAQMAALVARPHGWDQEQHPAPFNDRSGVDDNLWASVGTLAYYNVARGFGDGTYRPLDPVAHAQTISFITRAMVTKGYWTLQPDDPALYPNVPANSGHRQDIATFVHYAGALPGTSGTGATWGVWDQPNTRGWFAEALWRALDSYFRLDRTP